MHYYYCCSRKSNCPLCEVSKVILKNMIIIESRVKLASRAYGCITTTESCLKVTHTVVELNVFICATVLQFGLCR